MSSSGAQEPPADRDSTSRTEGVDASTAPLAEAQLVPQPGEIIEQCEIVATLEVGPVYAKHLVRDHQTGAQAVLKHSIHILPEADAALLHWAQLRRRINSRHLLGVRRTFQAIGKTYMVLDYVEGSSLEDILGDGAAWDESRTLDMAAHLMALLFRLHGAGILHRSISTRTIIIQPDGLPMLLEPEHSRIVVASGGRKAFGGGSSALHVMPNNCYAPIELWAAKAGRMGPWTDVYSLAAVLYHCLLGEEPPSAPDSVGGTGDRNSLRIKGEGVLSEAIIAWLEWGIAPMPAQRPSSIPAWRQHMPSYAAAAAGPMARPASAAPSARKTMVRGQGAALSSRVALHVPEPQPVVQVNRTAARQMRTGKADGGRLFGSLATAAAVTVVVVWADTWMSDGRPQRMPTPAQLETPAVPAPTTERECAPGDEACLECVTTLEAASRKLRTTIDMTLCWSLDNAPQGN